jgi:endonuclease YncB( thermonuclease family)
MRRLAALVLFWMLACGIGSAAAEDFTSYAIVREDGSLLIQNRVIRLYGIYLPETGVNCRTKFSPAECGTRGALALEFKTANQFVTCREVAALSDGSISATCWIEGAELGDYEDLAAYLIRQGWAVSVPGAPFEYTVLERIAEQQGVGVWGFQVDSLRLNRRIRH